MSTTSTVADVDGLALQKWLQRIGGFGRAEAQQAIAAGRVTVDGALVTRFAEPVAIDAAIAVDGELIAEPAERAVWLMHKPKKHITALVDPEGRPALAQYVPADAPAMFPVGRLDFNTEGALLFTNDGVLARRVLHPEVALPKRYRVKVRGHLTEDDPGFAHIRAGLTVGNTTYRPAPVRIEQFRTRATWIELQLTEGRHREIRRMCAANGWQIVKLRRESIGPIELGDLNPRVMRPLTRDEVRALDDAVAACVAAMGEHD